MTQPKLFMKLFRASLRDLTKQIGWMGAAYHLAQCHRAHLRLLHAFTASRNGRDAVLAARLRLRSALRNPAIEVAIRRPELLLDSRSNGSALFCIIY